MLYVTLQAGDEAGTLAVLVLTGFHTAADQKYYPNCIPTCILNSIADLPTYINFDNVTQSRRRRNP